MSLKFKPLAFFIVCLLFSLYISQTTCIPHKPTNQVPIALVSGEGESEREVRFQRRGPLEMSKVRKVGHLLKQHHQRLGAAALNKEARAPVELSKSDLVSMSITSRAMASFIENLMEEIDPADEDVSLEVDMINVFNTFYITPATISGTEINFIMDTGSSGIVTNSDLCKTFGCVNNAAVETQTKIYWEQGGECAISLDEHWDIVYGSGTVECRLGEALVDVGGMQIPKQSLCLIENEEGILYKGSYYQGIFGLSFNFGDEIPTFLENVMQHFDLQKRIFTMSMPREAGEVGLMTLGYAKQELYYGDIVYHDVIMKPYWTLKLDGILLNGIDMGFCHDTTCGVIIDSGSSYNAIPSSFLVSMINFMETETPWGSCSNFLAYPTITYVINEEYYSLEPWEYLTLIGEDFYSNYDPDVTKSEIKDCFMNFSSMDYTYNGMQLWLIGDTLMSKLYTVFDFGNERVGFADHRLEETSHGKK